MANRTQIVCLHEGKQGRSIDPLFIRTLIKKLDPSWIRPWSGSNVIRTVDCGGRSSLMARLPDEIRAAEQAGGNTTIIVWADVDDEPESPDELKAAFWKKANDAGIERGQFDKVVFAFAKDRIENWIEFLTTGHTDESIEGPRVRHGRQAVDAARALAQRCGSGNPNPRLPASLEWSCNNWRTLARQMQS